MLLSGNVWFHKGLFESDMSLKATLLIRIFSNAAADDDDFYDEKGKRMIMVMLMIMVMMRRRRRGRRRWDRKNPSFSIHHKQPPPFL